MRSIGVVTTSRADYGLLKPVMARIADQAGLELVICAAGMHLLPQFGGTVREIEADGFVIAERLETLLPGDSPEATAKSIGLGVDRFAAAYARRRPDLLLIMGDRFEMYAAALAALPFLIPLAHVHGGEVTLGAIDEALRHSLTKLSHLHFTSTEAYAQRVIQLGEEPWRVMVSGAPALDNLVGFEPLSPEELRARFGLDAGRPFLLATFHPVTKEYDRAGRQIDRLLAALDHFGWPVVFTLPNADTGGRVIIDRLTAFAQGRPWVQVVASLGTAGYFSLMSRAAALVGNSSSGIIEAPSFGLPAVNIGRRQEGRVRAANVIDVGDETTDILAGLEKAVSNDFAAGLKGLVNPYGDGRAAPRIVDRLASIELDEKLVMKKFHDLAAG